MLFPDSEYSGLDSLSTGTMVLDASGVIRYVNPATETLLGVSGAVLVGDVADHAFARSPEFLTAIQTARSEQETVIEYELDVAVNGHPPIRVGCNISPLDRLPDGVLIEMRAVDPHLRIARLEQARLQQEANRELLRNLAHEIKNPLGGIRGAAQLLEHELNNPGLREYTQVIIKEADRLQDLMKRLLSPHRPMLPGPVNIHEILERVRSLLKAEFPQTLTVCRDYDTSLPDLVGDREQLIQAILNIARNAAQAIKAQSNSSPVVGQITLKTRVARQVTLAKKRHRLALEVQVIDNGPGIPDDIRERMFYPLVSGREGGSGLGLTLAQSFVQQHQGTIECESRPGYTCFSIRMPLGGA